MDIASAQYYNDLEGNQLGIKITVDTEIMDVPLDFGVNCNFNTKLITF